MENKELLTELGDFFKIFADATRIRILELLTEQECCVSEIADKLMVSQSAISHQLRVLKQAKLVKFKKVGKTVYYSLDDDHVRTILSMGMEHIEER